MSRAVKVALAGAAVAVVAVSLVRRRKHGGSERVLRAYYDAWADGDGDAVRELLADDYCGHVHTLSGTEEQDADALAARVESHAGAFDRVDYEVEDVLCHNGEVAARLTLRARHRETEREAETAGLVILRVQGGRIEEEWSSWDYLGLAEQLGLSG
jgi:ketosteroid isomerase-like protein